MAHRSLVVLLVLACCALARGQESAGRYAHLLLEEGGPPWTPDSLRAAIPPGAAPMEVDPRVPISKVDDPAGAMLAALDRLTSSDRKQHEEAFRIVGATVKHAGLHDAMRLLSFLMYHGVGTRRDEEASVRAIVPLIRAGDGPACEFAAVHAPATFKNATTRVSAEKLKALKERRAIQVTGTIASFDDGEVHLFGIEPTMRLRTKVENLAEGRRVNVWGLLTEEGVDALIAEVPKPSANFKWKVDARPVRGGWWQVHSVSVTVSNNGVQPIKSVRFNVRCFINDGAVNDQTQTASVDEIAPGKSRTVRVGFEMYNYQYIDAVSVPRAEVTVRDVEW